MSPVSRAFTGSLELPILEFFLIETFEAVIRSLCSVQLNLKLAGRGSLPSRALELSLEQHAQLYHHSPVKLSNTALAINCLLDFGYIGERASCPANLPGHVYPNHSISGSIPPELVRFKSPVRIFNSAAPDSMAASQAECICDHGVERHITIRSSGFLTTQRADCCVM